MKILWENKICDVVKIENHIAVILLPERNVEIKNLSPVEQSLKVDEYAWYTKNSQKYLAQIVHLDQQYDFAEIRILYKVPLSQIDQIIKPQ